MRPISGEANPSMVYLLNNNEKFPRLTEEEERFHGALLSKTTYGMLQRIFYSIRFDENAINSIKNLYYGKNNKEDFVHSDIAIVGSDIGEVDNYDLRTIDEESLDYYLNKRAFNLMKMSVDNMYEYSMLVHEVTAKYLSFLYSASYYSSKYSSELVEKFEIEMNHLVQIRTICDLVGCPFDNQSVDWFAQNFVYYLGKYSLSTNELSLLSGIRKREDLREKILKNDYWDTKTPNERFEHLLTNISPQKVDEFRHEFNAIEHIQKPFKNVDYVNGIQLYFEDILHELGNITSDTSKLGSMMMNSCKLTLNLQNSLLALKSSFLKGKTLSYTKSESGEIIDLSIDPFYFRRPLADDSSLVVYREPRFCEKDDVVELAFLDFIKLVIREKPNTIIIVPLPQSKLDAPIVLYVYPRKVNRQSSISTSVENLPAIIETQINSKSDLNSIETKLESTMTIWMFRTIHDSGFTDYKGAISRMSETAREIVYLDIVNDYTENLNSSLTLFYEGHLSQSSKDWIDSDTQTYLGMIKIDKDCRYTQIASVPYYVRELFFRYKKNCEKNNIECPRFLDNEVPEEKRYLGPMTAGILVFEAAYLYDLLPEQLFDKYSKEEQWLTIRRIFE